MKTCYWKSTLLLSSIFIALIFKSTAQCPVADFTIASPVCAGSALNITNISTNSTSYEWDFSPGYLSQSASRLSDTSLSLSYPGDITSITQNDTLITFISGKGDGKVYRAIYGNGPQNPLTQLDDLGNLGGTTYQPSDVTLYQENFEWYGNYTEIIGISPSGRATVSRLKLNRDGLVNLRQVLVNAGLHPPF